MFAALAELERTSSASARPPGWPPPEARGRWGRSTRGVDRPQLQAGQETNSSVHYTVAVMAKTLGGSLASIYRHLTRDSG
jgi:hypothetical protein